MGGHASTQQTIPRLSNDTPRSGGIAAPTLADLSPRNRARLARVYLDGIASLTTPNRSDESLRAYLLARIGEIDALAPPERQEGA